MQPTEATDGAGITTIRRRVDYSETDQMGVVYHARYLVWFDVARTEHLRQTGLAYRDLEALGTWPSRTRRMLSARSGYLCSCTPTSGAQ